jgi:hypothetical protein
MGRKFCSPGAKKPRIPTIPMTYEKSAADDAHEKPAAIGDWLLDGGRPDANRHRRRERGSPAVRCDYTGRSDHYTGRRGHRARWCAYQTRGRGYHTRGRG